MSNPLEDIVFGDDPEKLFCTKHQQVNFSHDTDASAVYVRVDGNPMGDVVADISTVQVHSQVILDLDSKGRIVGVEILLPSRANGCSCDRHTRPSAT